VHAAAILREWGGFYATVGSAAAALTGLMFVVITLVGDRRRSTSRDGISTFSSPTVAHFCCALLVAFFMLTPLRAIAPIAILLILVGAGGLVYVGCIALRVRRLDGDYTPDTEDVIWHVLLPALAYALLAGGGIALAASPARALYAPAVAVTLLVFIGIHNAWDVVTFIAVQLADDAPDAAAGGD
jgi:hypothetical protein